MGNYEREMRKYLLLIAIFLSIRLSAQERKESVYRNSVVTNSFGDNWYAQAGVDMNLLFPKDHNIADVFPNGKSFGVNIAVGKWFSPEFGGRLNVTWNNGILRNP